jgi:signal transduction histidine kinase
MRFVLAFSALIIIFIDPTEPDRLVFGTYSALILYTLYSGIFYLLVRAEHRLVKSWLVYSHWIDIACYLILISLSSGTSSIFFFFFFFAVLHASFGHGFTTGFNVTIVSVIAFNVVGFLTQPTGKEVELDRFLLRPLYLMVLGYMMAYWGEYEIRAKNRLGLLRNIGILANPRFGVDRTIGQTIELLRDFYKADGCLLIMPDAGTGQYVLRRAEPESPQAAMETHSLNRQLAQKLLALPETYAAVYERRHFPLFGIRRRLSGFDMRGGKAAGVDGESVEIIAEKLDADSFLTVPVNDRQRAAGRIYIFSRGRRIFEQTDVEFLIQAVNQFMPVVENIRLVDQLASSAADEERKKIARDIHDSIVQPYIGLQLGIDSVVQMLQENEANGGQDFKKREIIKNRIHRLKDLTDRGIDDLRGYINGLSQSRGYETSLLPSICRFTEKFTAATGIEVEIKTAENIRIADRLAAELFQIVAEALSNVRRHTSSSRAQIGISADEEKIVLEIANDNDDNDSVYFIPKSIAGRAEALGGFLTIATDQKQTVVRVKIPL